jgi:hypothetical protein
MFIMARNTLQNLGLFFNLLKAWTVLDIGGELTQLVAGYIKEPQVLEDPEVP